MKSITFSLDYMRKEADKTFSLEGLLSFKGVVEDYLNKQALIDLMQENENGN